MSRCWKLSSRSLRKWASGSWKCGDRYVKVLLLLEPNVNHIGTIYAGSLFSIGEYIGGPIFVASFDYTRFYPVVKAVNVQFCRPATTDVTVETMMGKAEAKAIQREAEAKGKADRKMYLEVKNQSGEICCQLQGVWQLRKWR